MATLLVGGCSGGGVEPNPVVIPQVPAQLNDGWEVSSLEAQGMSSSRIGELVHEIRFGEYDEVHGLLIARHGILVFEDYFAPGHATDVKHQLNSVTKSVTSALIGVAVGRGIIEGVDQPMADLFPEYSETFDSNPGAGEVTLRQHLTMTSGIEWADGVGFEVDNDTYRMDQADDPIRFVLEKQVIREPGTVFAYNSGSSMLLSGLLRNAAGVHPEEFARELFFGPLGITDFIWLRHTGGLPEAHGGLSMRGRDLARIGQLFLQGGNWNGEQITPESWIAESTTDWTATDGDYRYGYQWWLDRLNPAPGIIPEPNDIVIGSGYGGEKLYMVPKLDLVVVFFGCDENGCAGASDFVPRYALKQFIIPAIEG